MTVGAFKSPIKEETRKLCDSKLAPNPRRARTFMAEKGIECDTVQVDIIQGENLGEDFLAINPGGAPHLGAEWMILTAARSVEVRKGEWGRSTLKPKPGQCPPKFPKRSASTLCR